MGWLWELFEVFPKEDLSIELQGVCLSQSDMLVDKNSKDSQTRQDSTNIRYEA